GRQVRDFNRNLQIDKPDVIDPFKGVRFPDEDITFSSMFVPGTSTGLVTNTLGEDLNGDGVLDGNENDAIPNGVLDKGILASATGPTPGQDLVPWNFDVNNGGFVAFRHPDSKPGSLSTNNTWEWTRFGICGFQSAILDTGSLGTPWFQNNGAGLWPTGDGKPATPAQNSTSCDSYPHPTDPTTPQGE